MNPFRSIKKSLLFSSFLVQTFNVDAQQTAGNYSVSGWWGPAAPTFSPVVHKDNRITFRLKAPQAAQAAVLLGEWNVRNYPMNKDSAGNWTATSAPVEPGIHSYIFLVDGIKTLDMVNPSVKIGTEIYSSMVEVPGNPARFDEIQPVPQGSMHMLTYFSTPLQRLRRLYVYLPPQYQDNKRYPVLYLRHGGGDNESSWTQPAGRANVILDNLIAKKQAVPMMIVMTNGLTDGSWAGGSSKEGMELLESELINDIIPLVDKTYPTIRQPGARAIAGLSMGGGQAYVMGLKNLDKFSWIGEFSSGLLSDTSFQINERAPGVFDNPGKVNKALRLLWIGCGTDDPRMPGHASFAQYLKNRGIRFQEYNIPGGHEWKVWREELKEFMTRLFQ